ncbi:MAG TPA: PfkB family carbohydrate kinase [Streptosporangiales bacterium]
MPDPTALFVGAATWDVVADLPHLPAPDGRVVADDVVGAGGGPASTAAVAYARLGLPARLAATGGADREGAALTGALDAAGVDTSLVRTVPGAASGSCVVLVDRSLDARAICVRPGPQPQVDADDVLGVSLLHVDHLGLPAVQPHLARVPAGHRPVVSYDAGNLDPRRCPPWVDLYVPTLAALAQLYGPGGTDALLDTALADGATWVVATDGPRGAVAADRDGHYRIPAHDVAVRSTLGAGDVFHGALLAAYARGLPLPDALAYANAAAAASCRGLDGRSGIAGHEETVALARRLPATRTATAPM